MNNSFRALTLLLQRRHSNLLLRRRESFRRLLPRDRATLRLPKVSDRVLPSTRLNGTSSGSGRNATTGSLLLLVPDGFLDGAAAGFFGVTQTALLGERGGLFGLGLSD